MAEILPAPGDLQPVLRMLGSAGATADLLGRVLATLPSPIAVYDASDEDFRVVYMNGPARDLAGLSDGEVTGRPFLEVYRDALPQGAIEAFRVARRSGVTQSRRRYRAASGRTWDFDIFLLASDSGRYLVAAGTPAPSPTGSLDLETLIQSTAATWLPAPPRELAARATEQGVRIVEGVECMVTFISADQPDELEIVAGTGPWAESLIGRRMPAAGTFSGQAIGQRASVETTSARRTSSARAHLEEGPMDTLRVVPLATDRPFPDGRGALGVIGFYRPGSTPFTNSERQLMDQFGRWITLSLHRAELLETAQAAARRLQMSVDLAIDLGASLDTQTVIERLLHRALNALAADRVSILRVEGDSTVVEGSLDRQPHLHPPYPTGTRHRIFSTVFRQMLASGMATLATHDPAEYPEEMRNQALAQKHSLTVPLIHRGEVFAALAAVRRVDRPFGGDDVALLQQVGAVAGLALRNAGLYKEVEDSRDRARAIARSLRLGVEVAVDLSSQLDPDEVVRRLLRRVTGAVGADRGTLSVVDGDSVVVMDSFSNVGPAAEPGSRWGAAPGSLIDQAIRTQRPSQASEGDETYARSDKVSGFKHGLAVPLIVQGKVLYILGLARATGQHFTEDEIATLQQVGNVAVLSLRNAQLFRAKTDFMNLAAHELRTPLAVLNGYVSMLQDGTFGPPSETWEKPVGVLAGKTRELGQLVENLLVGARLEGGHLSGSRLPVDVVSLTRAAIERAQARLALLRGDLREDLPEGPILVEGDPEQLGRILDNLINNALTYSDGTPEISVVVGGGESAEVRVVDHGRGIPAELHERVFEQFYRVEEPGAGNPAGTGLGLYISRQLAARHGGTLTIVESEPGRGSTFALRLPLVLG